MIIYCDKAVAVIDAAAPMHLVMSLYAKRECSQSCSFGAANILSHKQDAVYGEGKKQVGVSLHVSVEIMHPYGLYQQ